MGVRYDLEQPGVRARLIADIADGDRSTGELAREYGVRRQAIYLFRDRHADEIEAARAIVQAALADMWVAVKRERLSALMDDLEEIEERMSAALHGEGAALDLDSFIALVREKRAHLRACAEEMGDIPRSRPAEIEVDVVRYEIVGVDLGELR